MAVQVEQIRKNFSELLNHSLRLQSDIQNLSHSLTGAFQPEVKRDNGSDGIPSGVFVGFLEEQRMLRRELANIEAMIERLYRTVNPGLSTDSQIMSEGSLTETLAKKMSEPVSSEGGLIGSVSRYA